MKKHICFAGFADSEIRTLRAAAANPLWECHFVADASAALALLSEHPLDALVANLTLPGKTGADLLREARESHPQILGFIVGGGRDQAHIINSIGGPHQFIRRPFDAAKLAATLKHGLSLDTWLATEGLHKLVPRLRRLPSLPSTYFNLLRELESDSVTTQNIGAIIARDPVVTARLLQMVNSAAFSPAQKVTDPADAVAVLGIETLKSLVLGLQVFSQADEARKAGLSLEILWEHSLLVAKYARLITLKQTGDSRFAGDAFTAGLLHDVGRIVIASNLPAEYAAVIQRARESGRPLHEEEDELLGVSHAQVGAYLLGLWGMPTEFVEAAAGHHAPSRKSFACEFSLLGAVHAANVFAHASGGQTDGLCLPQIDLDYFEALHLGDQLALWQEACTGEKPPVALPQSQIPETVSAPLANPGPVLIQPPARPLQIWMAVLLLLLLTGLLAWYFQARSVPPANNIAANPVTNGPAVPPPAAPVKAAPPASVAPILIPAPASPPPPSAFSQIRVQGILYQASHPLAIINGQTLGIGDRINDVQVLAIDPHSVTLEQNGERKVFPFN